MISLQCFARNEIISCNIMYVFIASCHISCLNRPPNEDIRDIIDIKKYIYIFPLTPKNVNSILCGDFNVNLYNLLHLKSIDEFVNSLSGQGYFPLILKPTRFSLRYPVNKYSLLYQMWCNYFDGYDCFSGLKVTMICLTICQVIIYI